METQLVAVDLSTLTLIFFALGGSLVANLILLFLLMVKASPNDQLLPRSANLPHARPEPKA